MLFSFFIQRKSRFIKDGGNPSKRYVIVDEPLNGIDIDGIGNLEDLPIVVFIDEECENIKGHLRCKTISKCVI